MKYLWAGAVYFLLTFAAGFLFGSVRQLVLAPVVGETAAVAIEAPFMIVVMVLAARWVIARFDVGALLGARAAVGLTALGLLLAVEALLSGPIRGWSFAEWLAHFATSDGLLSLALFLLFAAMPVIVSRTSK